MRLKSERGQNLVSLMLSVALIAIISLFAATAVQMISQTLRTSEDKKRMVVLDADIANLLVLPQLCSCNFAGVKFADPKSVFDWPELNFFAQPGTPCAQKNPNPVVKVGAVHAPSRHQITNMKLGPFHPLGQSGNYLADFEVSVEGSTRPLSLKVMFATELSAGTHEVKFCGQNVGQVPTAAVPYAGKLNRFTQYSLNFGCPALPAPAQHTKQAEPYVVMRNQYFWPEEEGDMITEYETTRVAGTAIAPTSFSSFSGSAVCFEESGIGDNVRLIVPSHFEKRCPALKQNFLTVDLKNNITDVGFSLLDNCKSRFY